MGHSLGRHKNEELNWKGNIMFAFGDEAKWTYPVDRLCGTRRAKTSLSRNTG